MTAEAYELPAEPGATYTLPFGAGVQWRHALLAAEREPRGSVVLEGQTVLAVHDAIAQAVRNERERCAGVCEQMRAVSAVSYELGTACAAAIRAG
jgi:hypothetical protein